MHCDEQGTSLRKQSRKGHGFAFLSKSWQQRFACNPLTSFPQQSTVLKVQIQADSRMLKHAGFLDAAFTTNRRGVVKI
jgi:hypothetical protein